MEGRYHDESSTVFQSIFQNSPDEKAKTERSISIYELQKIMNMDAHLNVRNFKTKSPVQNEWGQYTLFAYSMAVILDTLGFCMEKVFYCSNFGFRLNDFNFYVMGKAYVVFIVRNSCFGAIVLKVVKLQVISSCSEQNIFILVHKMHNVSLISVLLSRLIDTV